MLFVKLWKFLCGYIIISVEGNFIEKFINICIKRKIVLWNIIEKGTNLFYMNISIKSFKALRQIVKKSYCRVKIHRKKGIPFIINRYKKRKFFLIGALVFVIIIAMLSSFIWEIQIVGNKKIPDQVIRELLESFGVKFGAIKYKINTSKIANEILLKNNEISWICVDIKGTTLKIEIAERKMAPKLIPNDSPCRIVAKKDGMIKSIVTKAGDAKIKNGSIVTTGQLLISDIIEIKNGTFKKVHAMGEVKASTWYEDSALINLVLLEKMKTGKVIKNYTIKIGEKKFNLFHSDINFKNYDIATDIRKFTFFKNYTVPLKIETSNISEIKIIEKTLDYEDAKALILEKLRESMKKNMPYDALVVNEEVRVKLNENGQEVLHLIIECLEDIGEVQESE